MRARTRNANSRQERAFEVYYGQGAGRSYRAVAKEVGASEPTVKLWGRRYGWQERVRERNLEVARAVADRSVQNETERKDRLLKVADMAILQVAKAIAEGKVKPSMADLDRLIRLRCFLSDEPDSRTEHVVGDLSGKSREELQAMLAGEIKVAKSLGLLGPKPSSSRTKPEGNRPGGSKVARK